MVLRVLGVHGMCESGLSDCVGRVCVCVLFTGCLRWEFLCRGVVLGVSV